MDKVLLTLVINFSFIFDRRFSPVVKSYETEGPYILISLALRYMHIHTPANENVPPEVLPLREEGHSQESVQIQTLHQ